jgi:DNA-binding response OmpR family regulator
MSKIKILLVDDEKDFRESTARTLSRRGFTVDDVGGGPEALVYLQTSTPDLIILDLKMAEMDGITTLQHIRKIQSKLPVIILTGHGDFDSALSGIKLEIVDFLQKPVDIDFLAHKINQLLSVKWVKPLAEKSVTELMVPVDSYRSVHTDQLAVEALKQLRESATAPVSAKIMEIGHRSILVKDRSEKVVGLLRIVDVLGMATLEWLFNTPYRSFYTGMFLAQCKVLGDGVISDFIDEEKLLTITEHTPLIEATVLMAENNLINLPVTRDGRVVGILRDKDIFQEILHIALGD